jgi:hypothetical protein
VVGAIVNAHAGGGGLSLWVIVNVRPAIVSVVERGPPGFGATANSTNPFPLPEAPVVITTQSALLVAVQVQPTDA